MRSLRAAAAGALSVAAALAVTLALPAAAHAATATFTRTSQWPGGYVASVTVQNDTSVALTGWQVAFDLPTGTRVSNHWSAELARDGQHHVFANAGWNGALAPGASVTFGWIAAGDGDPANCTVDGDPCGGGPAPTDLRSPTAPGDVRVVTAEGVTLVWAAATDDVGVVRYLIYESGMPWREVTGTSTVISTGPALPPKVYVWSVRAVDAAGNIGPAGFASLGAVWTGEDPPPAPAGLRVASAASDVLTLAWDRAPTLPFADPPIAGYEVFVDGVLADRVGGSGAVVRLSGPGPHRLTVRAFNVHDRYSAPVGLSYP